MIGAGRIALAGTVAAVGLGAVSCGGSTGSATPSTPVSVPTRLVDYDISVVGPVKPGVVTFQLANRGAASHSLLVSRTDLPVNQLPTTATGRFDPSGAGQTFLAESSVVPPGGAGQLTVTLPRGRYVLVCNLDDHFARAMVQQLVVG